MRFKLASPPGHRMAWAATAILLLGCLPAAAGSETKETRWTAIAASGLVQSSAGSEESAIWNGVSRGDRLQPKTRVKTGRKGRTTLTLNASLVMVTPDSEVELPAKQSSSMETSVVQKSGSVLYKVDSRKTPHFEVVTPYLVAGVKGTSFLVTVNDRYATVTVREGLVEITDPDTGQTLQLGPGETVRRERDEAELEIVMDRRLSREAAKQARLMEPADDEGGALADALAEERGERDANDDRSMDGKVQGTADHLNLIEDMIRDEIEHGVILSPGEKIQPELGGLK